MDSEWELENTMNTQESSFENAMDYGEHLVQGLNFHELENGLGSHTLSYYWWSWKWSTNEEGYTKWVCLNKRSWKNN